nr:MAG: amino acid ABC transporter permease [Actinomycetota bacterium]
MAVYATTVLGLNLMVGYSGILSLGQGATFGFGAYITAILASHFEWPIWATLPVSLVAGFLLGAVTGLPAGRLLAIGLAMVSLGMVIVFGDMLVLFADITGGNYGVAAIYPRFGFGTEPITGKWLVPLLVVGVMCLAYWLHGRYRTTPFGRATVAVRDEAIGATAYGVSGYLTKVASFAVGSALGALGGGLFSYLSAYISPDAFRTSLSISFLTMVVLGGAGSRIGPVVGTVLLVLVPLALARYPVLNAVLYGALLMVLVRWRPRGLFSRTAAPAPSLQARVEAAGDAEPPAEVPAGSTPALRVVDVHRRFGGLAALGDVSLDVRPGEILGLIGPNGSGKTTLLNVVCGYYPATAGRVELDGTDITTSRPSDIARHGLARTFQTPKTFPSMSIAEHLAMATESSHAGPERMAAYGKLALRTLGLAGLTPEDATRGPKESRGLAHGQLRFLEVATAIARAPKVLLLDEPAAGLSHSEIEGLEAVVEEVSRLGTAVVVVEHHLDMIGRLVDRVVVLDLGKVLWAGVPSELHDVEAVRVAYMGNG